MTWGLSAAFDDGTSFASEVEMYRLEDGALTVRTVGLETRVVEGRCIGLMAIPRPVAIRTVEELADRMLEELPAV